MAPFFRNGGRQVVPPSLIDHLYYSNSPAPLPNLDSNTIRLSDEAIARMMVQIYKDTWDLDTLVQSDVLKETQAIFTKAVDQGTPPSTPHRTAFKHQLTTSTDVFSAFRVHTQAQHMASLMVDAQGNLLAFDDWAERVQPYVNHQNRAWLRTEFDTAAIRAHNEADWQRFREDADVYPYLEWIPSTSDKPGEDHKVFWGTILPVSDPFWKEHHPGDRWNCKCSLQQTDRTPTRAPNVTDTKSAAQPGLTSQPGSGEIFSSDHVYYPKDCRICPFSKGTQPLQSLTSQPRNCNTCRLCSKIKR